MNMIRNTALALVALGITAQATFAATIDLSVDVSAQAKNEMVRAVVYAEESGQLVQASASVNAKVTKALSLAKKLNNVRVQTGAVRSFPVYGKDNRIDGWRIRSDVIIEGTNLTGISDLIGELQASMMVASIDYTPTKLERQSVERTLTTEAISAFKEKAGLVASALGKQYKIKTMSIQNIGTPTPPRPFLMRAAAAGTNSVPMEAGDTSLTVQINGQIEVD